MATCPHCRQLISGQPGTLANCPFCGGRVRFYSISASKRSSTPARINVWLPKIRQPPTNSTGIEKPDKEWLKQLEFKPQTKLAHRRPPIATKQKIIFRESFCEIHEDLGLIVFDLPLEEGEVKWEVKDGILTIMSLRPGFQYKEEVKIPSHWECQKPNISFLNGILSFYWEEKEKRN